MKFKKRILRRRFVESDGGGVLGGCFIVQFIGLFKLRYREAEHSVSVQAEPLKGETNWVVYLDTVQRWDRPFESEALTSRQVQTIRNNIISALNSMGVRYVASGAPGASPNST